MSAASPSQLQVEDPDVAAFEVGHATLVGRQRWIQDEGGRVGESLSFPTRSSHLSPNLSADKETPVRYTIEPAAEADSATTVAPANQWSDTVGHGECCALGLQCGEAEALRPQRAIPDKKQVAVRRIDGGAVGGEKASWGRPAKVPQIDETGVPLVVTIP